MIETFKEFTFDAAHSVLPHSGVHGHTFKVGVFLRGDPDPMFGWPANLFEVEREIEVVRQQLDHKYLNDIEGLAVPSLENVVRWIWERLENRLSGLDRIVVRRGADGHAEGCTYHGRM